MLGVDTDQTAAFLYTRSKLPHIALLLKFLGVLGGLVVAILGVMPPLFASLPFECPNQNFQLVVVDCFSRPSILDFKFS